MQGPPALLVLERTGVLVCNPCRLARQVKKFLRLEGGEKKVCRRSL
jgi:hypothetical protein